MGFLLLLCFCLIISFSSGTDTISANQSLSGDQTIISNGEKFELGFFKAGNSSNYYIGIWYKKVNPRTIVWVANRETPISDRYKSELKIVDGNLVLLNESKFQIWSTNVTTNLISAIAVIRDNGNLVLTDVSSSVDPVWQSFDHPVDTFLPGGKLVYNNITKQSQILTSWKSEENPAVGLYSLEIDPYQNRFICKWNGSQQYWTSGPWDGRVFKDVPEMMHKFIFSFSFVVNKNGSYFTYSLYDSSIISRFIIDGSGQLQQQNWMESTKQWLSFWSQPKTYCEIYAYCGSFGTCRPTESPFCSCLTGFKPRSQRDWDQRKFSGGCIRITTLQCGKNVEKLGFVMAKVLSLPPNNLMNVGSPRECRTSCLNNCSCNAYSFIDNQCLLWDGDLLNLVEDDADGKTIYIKVASKDLSRYEKNNRVPVGIVAGSVAGVATVLALVFLIVYGKKRMLVEKTTMEGLLVAFVYRDLQVATKNFSIKLGGGGFGSVFKGVLRDSSIVAVKRLESISQGEKEFRSEVSTIGTIQHINLVRLRGFCAEGNKKLLVYDFMPNGSLQSHLFHEKQDDILSWKTRYQIARGIARGLVYLHEKCRECIIHCDIKPENILLDAEFQPKIADFGLAKLVGRDFSRVLTSIRGTRGYLAPEWLSGVPVTAKADVFSYGMMLFELVHGKRNVEKSKDSSFTFFPSLAANVLMVEGDILSLLDSRLNREAIIEEVAKIFKVAYWCIQDEEDNRPSMSLVEQILEGVSDVDMPRIPQSVMFNDDSTEHLAFFSESFLNGSSQVHSNLSEGNAESTISSS